MCRQQVVQIIRGYQQGLRNVQIIYAREVLRQDLYQQTCVRANGTLYYNQKYKNVYVNCSCT